MSSNDMPMKELLGHLEVLANQSLDLWSLPEDAKARLINVSENATYLVEGTDWKSVLRIHRESYHSALAIACELAWSSALNNDGVIVTPGYIAGRDGEAIQSAIVEGLPVPRYMVMFEFVEGSEPDESEDLVGPFEELGQIAAKCHLHAMQWQRPEPFERLVWDLDAVFGSAATWGNWRDAPNVTPEISRVLERVEETVTRRIKAHGNGPEQYGLIHADMRLANLLIDDSGTRLIDFDDCGSGWFLYDFAAAISFMEDHPQIPDLKSAWVRGYRSVRALSDGQADEIETFIMMRRLALLAWIGSRIEAPEPQAMAPHFAHVSAELGSTYLDRFG